MAGNNAIGMAGKPFDGFPACAHVPDIIKNRKRAAAMEIAVVMRGVRSQHDRASRGRNSHHLQTVGMAANTMDGDTRRDFALAGMKSDALVIDMTHHQRHMLDRKRVA